MITTHCQTVIERYEEVISQADDNVVLDGVRHAFSLVKAQACMLATLFIPAIQDFLLPELKDAWHSVLLKRKGLVEDVGSSHSMSRVHEAAGEVNMMIMFFEDLIKDVVDHCKIPKNRIETRIHTERCVELRLHATRRALDCGQELDAKRCCDMQK